MISRQDLKTRAVFSGWIAGFILAGALLWSFTQPLRNGILLRAVNKALILAEDDRRLAAPAAGFSGKNALPGVWYTIIDSTDLFFVFSIMRGGVLIPCGVAVSREGKAAGIIPLGVHAKQVFGSLPQGLIDMYTRRAEDIFARNAGTSPARKNGGRRSGT